MFETHIERGLYTDADRVKIGQVIYNLVGNAVNYTGADKRVIVALRREENEILFSVKDTGAGVKKKNCAISGTGITVRKRRINAP